MSEHKFPFLSLPFLSRNTDALTCWISNVLSVFCHVFSLKILSLFRARVSFSPLLSSTVRMMTLRTEDLMCSVCSLVCSLSKNFTPFRAHVSLFFLIFPSHNTDDLTYRASNVFCVFSRQNLSPFCKCYRMSNVFCVPPALQDWWNSTSYARFYRTWNCVVHDWLYEYVYRDIVMWQVSMEGRMLG